MTSRVIAAQKRYIKCRLKKKLRLLEEQSCNAAARLQRVEVGRWSSLVKAFNSDELLAKNTNVLYCANCDKPMKVVMLEVELKQ